MSRKQTPLCLLCTIVERGGGQRAFRTYEKHGIALHYRISGEGTASSDLLDLLGFGTSERDILISPAQRSAVDALVEEVHPQGIYERSDVPVRRLEGLEQLTGVMYGTVPDRVEMVENGVHFWVDVKEGQKTGFFLDQKYNRRAVARLAAGHTVLDCFTHTGSFALNAASGGAARVTAADISADAIAMAQRNAERNGLTNMDFLCEDTFELLPRLEKEGHPYDFIILDPPAFTKARRTVENAMRGYKEINYRAMKLLPRGGYLATASCSHFATEELFIKMLRSAAKDAHRQLRQIEVRQQAPDHPILWGVPETNYLKFFLFQVI